MQHSSDASSANRPLTEAELNLCRWMLEHSSTQAQSYLSQLELAEVTSWRCPCGCASINFQVQGSSPPASQGIKPISEFVFGGPADLSCIFLYVQYGGVLGGLEVYGLAGDAPRVLPTSDLLRPWENAGSAA